MKCFDEFLITKGISLDSLIQIKPSFWSNLEHIYAEKRFKDGSVEPNKPDTDSEYIGAVRKELLYSDTFKEDTVWNDDDLFYSNIKHVDKYLGRARIYMSLSAKDKSKLIVRYFWITFAVNLYKIRWIFAALFLSVGLSSDISLLSFIIMYWNHD